MSTQEKSPQWLVFVSVAAFFSFSLLTYLVSGNPKLAVLGVASGFFGFLLKFTGCGFTSSFRNFVSKFDMTNMRNIFMLFFFGIALCQLVPIFFTKPLVSGAAKFTAGPRPIGWALVIGSFIFGAGMQFGSGCASGTFVGIGEGQIKSVIVLLFFIIGSTFASGDLIWEWFTKLPKDGNVDFQLNPIMVLYIVAFLYVCTFLPDFFKFTSTNPNGQFFGMRLLVGEPNPETNEVKSLWKVFGTPFLIALSISIFYLCQGSMIGVTGVFPKVGTGFLSLFGYNATVWKDKSVNIAKGKTLFDEPIFVSDIYIALGAFIATALIGTFGHNQKTSLYEIIQAVAGGLLMGIGAKMSSGCNIGALLSGIVSCNLSGFIWMFSALLGIACVVHVTIYIENQNKKQEYSKDEEVPNKSENL